MGSFFKFGQVVSGDVYLNFSAPWKQEVFFRPNLELEGA